MAKILIVDDSAVSRLKLRQIFEKFNHEIVAEAKTGSEAIRFFRQFNPDIVTMDIHMPDISGVDAAREITKISNKAKIIMITAKGEEKNVRDSIKSGALYYILKPFQDDKVIGVVNHILTIQF